MSTRLAIVAALGILTVGCFASHGRGDGAPARRDAGVAVVGDDAGRLPDAGVETDAGLLPCFCEGSPGCRLPLMCCPVTGTCENPAAFRCSGSVMLCP